MGIDQFRDLAAFQLHVAERWRDRASASTDPFARFFFCFASFNSLYYLWSRVDDLRGQPSDPTNCAACGAPFSPEAPSLPPNETKQIQHVLGKPGPEQALAILSAADPSIRFFAKRRAVERMDRRAGASSGQAREGERHRRNLEDSDASKRLKALGAIVYLVRSNLVHGSKMDQGDDEQVVVNSESALRAILDWCIEYTRLELRRT